MEADEDGRFQHLFISFEASIKGFTFCCPILFLDGTFLKSKSGGTLLSATAKDGQNGLFPIAFVVVSYENNDDWCWFLSHLQVAVVGNDDREVSFVSNRNDSLLEILPVVFPNSNHYYYLWHLSMNLHDKLGNKYFDKEGKDKVIWKFESCARAATIPVFEHKLANRKKFVGGSVIDNFLPGIPLEKWANAYSTSLRYGEMTPNAAESFNKWILEAWSLPLNFMVDCIRQQLMRLLQQRRTTASTWMGLFTFNMEKLWEKFQKDSRNWDIIQSTNEELSFLKS